MTSPAAQAVFAVASGALGLLFVLLGQRVWRAFLALSALFATGLLAFYLLLHNVAALPLWADGVIAGCLGALAAALAFFFSAVGLLACSGAAGFLLTWAILRVSHLAAVLDDATPGAHLMVACAVAALVLLVVLLCQCGAGCEQCCAAMGGGGEEAAARSPRSPPRTSRSFRSTRSPPSTRHRHPCAKLGEAAITAVIGAYGVVYCVAHWLTEPGHGISPAEIAAEFESGRPRTCEGACAALLPTFLALAAIGFVVQAVCIRGQHRGRTLEDEALREPFDRFDPLRGTDPPSRSDDPLEPLRRGTALAARVRDKYLGGRGGAAGPGSPVQDLDEYLTLAAERRQSSSQSSAPALLPAPQ